MKVIILYDLLAREYWSCYKIKKEFANLGHEAVIYSLNFEYFKALKYAKKNLVEFLIIPSCYSNADYQRIVLPFINACPMVKVVCSHVEQIGFKGREDELLCNEPFGKNTMFHVSWGSHFTKLLTKSGIKSNLVIETGNLRLEETLCDIKFDRKKLAEEFGLDSKKKWILYCDSATYFYYQMSSLSKRKKKKYAGVIYCPQAAEEYGLAFIETNKILNGLSKDFLDKYEIIYRPHPGINFDNKGFLNNKIHVIRDYSIYTWFKHVEYNIVFQSTTIFESECMGVKSFTLIPQPLSLEVVGLNDYYSVKNSIELERVVSEDIIQFESKVYENYMGILKPEMTREFVLKLISINETFGDGLDIVQAKVNPKKKYTSYIAYNFVYLFIKLRILNKIKHPKALDMNKYEHPYFSNKYIRD